MYADISYPFRILGIRSAYDYHWDSAFQFLGESHQFWETVCVLEGQVEVAEDEKIYILHAGDFICHASMEFHRIRSSNGSSPHVLVMSFRHEGTLPDNLKEGVFHLNPAELETYKSLFFDLYRFCHGEEADAYRSASIAFSLGNFFILLGSKQVRSNRSSRSKSRTAREYQLLVETMQASVRENLSLQDISGKTGISISTMKNLFYTYAGISPKAYYGQIRGLEALRLLKEGLELNEIAEIMHYSSPNYFSMAFKKQFGLPPGKYRKVRYD